MDRSCTADYRVGACLASSVDGRIWHPELPVLGSAEDRHVLESLRAQADVLLYGAGTARADSRRRIEFRCPDIAESVPGIPPIAVLGHRIDFDFSAPFWNSACPIAVVQVGATQTGRPPALPARIDHLVVPADPSAPESADLAATLRAVAAWAGPHRAEPWSAEPVRVLCEGGGQLIGGLMRREVLDELFLTVTP